MGGEGGRRMGGKGEREGGRKGKGGEEERDRRQRSRDNHTIYYQDWQFVSQTYHKTYIICNSLSGQVNWSLSSCTHIYTVATIYEPCRVKRGKTKCGVKWNILHSTDNYEARNKSNNFIL